MQILLFAIYFAGAAFSMFYLAETLYPKRNIVAVVASIFYVLNFFVNFILLNIGMMWTYAFLPLLIALFARIFMERRNPCKRIIYFALAFTAVASLSSMNIANVALVLISLSTLLIYYVILERRWTVKQLSRNLLMLTVITFLLSVWWIIPISNYYISSTATQLQKDVNVRSWSWTQSRASFLNLFWLNGGWGWRSEYFPYYNYYSNNPILLFLMFTPFFLACIPLLSKDEKSKFHAYIMATILISLFLAKGLHEPLGFVNLFLYDNVPYMNMFREPISL